MRCRPCAAAAPFLGAHASHHSPPTPMSIHALPIHVLPVHPARPSPDSRPPLCPPVTPRDATGAISVLEVDELYDRLVSAGGGQPSSGGIRREDLMAQLRSYLGGGASDRVAERMIQAADASGSGTALPRHTRPLAGALTPRTLHSRAPLFLAMLSPPRLLSDLSYSI